MPSCSSLPSSPDSARQCASSVRVPLSLPPPPHPLPLPLCSFPVHKPRGTQPGGAACCSRSARRPGEVRWAGPLPTSASYQEVAGCHSEPHRAMPSRGPDQPHLPAALLTARQVREGSSFSRAPLGPCSAYPERQTVLRGAGHLRAEKALSSQNPHSSSNSY